MDLVDIASQVVVPAVRAVFKEGEVSALELRVDDQSAGSVELTVTARGETFVYPVIQGTVQGMSTADWSENLRSLLVDFVAESRFGWGQDRDVR